MRAEEKHYAWRLIALFEAGIIASVVIEKIIA